ncbi:MAG TPA: hypothetical protein VLA73_07470 [Burkholderiales bacterium]|nr:hypothetical protein [Burkholderiales bacterium]
MMAKRTNNAASLDCHLLVRLWPERAADAFPALQTLLSRAEHRAQAAESIEAWLCRSFGVARQHDWPIAPLTLAVDGAEPGSYYWLRADPVHLSVRGVELVLAPPGSLDLTRAEADALTAALNQHFSDDGLRFQALTPLRWYLRLDRPPELRTCMPSQVAGRRIESFLPEGADRARWRRLFNEAQMVLHQHAVNQEREDRDRITANSLWFWGGGSKPTRINQPFAHVWSDCALARGLGLASGARLHSLPPHATHWLDCAESGSHLLVWESRASSPDTASRLEAEWFAPLLRELKAGRPRRLILTLPSPSGVHQFELTRGSLWRIWRPRKPLSTYFSSPQC